MTCETVAVIGATLANGGVAPITGEKVLKPDAGLWHFLHFVNSIFLSFSLNHIQSSCIFVFMHAVRDVLSLLHSCGFYEYSGEFAFKVDLVYLNNIKVDLVSSVCIQLFHSRLSLESIKSVCHMSSITGLFQVGIPGKSSVAGCMMMVLPNTMGICLWSPPLDKYGNSARGLE